MSGVPQTGTRFELLSFFLYGSSSSSSKVVVLVVVVVVVIVKGEDRKTQIGILFVVQYRNCLGVTFGFLTILLRF